MRISRQELLAAAGGGVTAAAIAATWEDAAAGVVVAGALGVLLGAYRRFPRAAWAVAAAGFLALGDELPAIFLAGAHGFCTGRFDGWHRGLPGMVALMVGGAAAAVLTSEALVPFLMVPPVGWAAGRALRERELLVAQLHQRAQELEEERDAYAALSVRYERARIASELHDIVAHAMSVMVVQAGAGQRLAARDPALAAEAFDAIAEAAREAEQDMSRLVALLADEAATAPAPDLALVEELVARATGAGLDVSLRLEGEREGLPPAVVEAAFRVVQEALTNALRYAAGAAVRVTVAGDRERLLVTVENGAAAGHAALAGAGTGSGLRGLRERVGACGGTLSAGPTAAGGWRVEAALPRGVAAARTG